MNPFNLAVKIKNYKPAIKEYTYVIILAVFCLTVLGITTGRLTPDTTGFWGKVEMHPHYIQNAITPLSDHFAPFAYRILVPTLVHYSGVDIYAAFFAQTMIFLFLSAIILYAILRQLKFNILYSASGMLFFMSIYFVTRFNIWDFYLCDAAAYFFILLTILLILRESNDVLIILTLCIGVLVKETVIFALPLYYFLGAKKIIDRDRALRFIIITIPVIYTFLVPRIYIETHSKQMLIDLIGPNLEVHYMRLKTAFWDTYMIDSFGMFLVILPFFAVSKNKDYFLRTLIYFSFILSQLILGSDSGRMLVYLFPVLVPISVCGLESLVTYFRADGRWAFGFSLATFAVFTVFINGNFKELIEVSAYFSVFIAFLVALYLNAEKKGRNQYKFKISRLLN